MRAVLVSLIAGLASPALLRELPDPQWIVLAALFGLALAMLASRTRRLPWLAVILGCTWYFSWAYQQQGARLVCGRWQHQKPVCSPTGLLRMSRKCFRFCPAAPAGITGHGQAIAICADSF